jgi:hypothetical protein
MADVQSQMIKFHEAIKLKRFNENEILRDKREIILKRLDSGLKKLDINPTPKYEVVDQGSYAMDTGVKPLNGDYDIDIGISFKISKDDYPDPLEPKKWVHDSLVGHTKKVEIHRPCVTVYYQISGEPAYHVDLAVYSDKDNNPDGKIYLAKGKEHSHKENKIWEESNYPSLIDLMKNHFQDSEDAKQFRRTIRYLKRWKDLKFQSEGNAAPIGIGITIAAYKWFTPNKINNSFDNTTKYNDLEALKQFIEKVLSSFQSVYIEGIWASRLVVILPVAPSNDIFKKMTNSQMLVFKENLQSLFNSIEKAQQEVDPKEACALLNKQFGSDFSIPTEKETAQKRSPAIVSSSASA